MKRTFLSAAALAVVLAAPALADEGFYVKGGVGYGVVEELSGNLGDQSDAEIDPEGDARFNLGAGFAMANGFRWEVELFDRYADGGAIDDTLFSASDLHNTSLSLNAIYDFNRDGKWQPYVGLGVGYSETRMSLELGADRAAAYGFPADQGITVKDEDRGVSYQGLLGLGVALSDRLTADFGYRYYYGNDVEINKAPVSGASALNFDNFTGHDVTFGLRYAFGGAPKAAPAAPAPAPAAPPTAPVPQAAPACSDVPFVVYFEWNQSILTDQAKQVIANAASRAKTCEITRVAIEGHADRSGSASYNVGLSEKRARIVRDELIRLGVPASLITIEAKGESEPAVATPDGKREPLNRRAEVVIRVK